MITTKTYIVSVAYTTPWDLTKRRISHYSLSNPSDAYKVAIAGGFTGETHFTQVNEMTTMTFSPESGINQHITFSESISLDHLKLMAEGHDAIELKKKEAAALDKLEKSLTDTHVIDDTTRHPIPRK
jgi:hypothetical protein